MMRDGQCRPGSPLRVAMKMCRRMARRVRRAGHPPDQAGVRTRRIDDRSRVDRPARRLDGGDAAGLDANPGDLGIALDRDARRLRGPGEAHGHAIGIGDAVARAERRAERAIHVEPGRQPGGVLRVEPQHVHAQAALQRDVLAKRRDARRRRQ